MQDRKRILAPIQPDERITSTRNLEIQNPSRKVWWSLRAYGRKAYATAIDRLFDLAAYMGERIQAEPELELMAPVGFNAVCVRCRHLDQSQNENVLTRLVSEGTAFLGRAQVKGRFCLRACFMNLRTTREDVDLIVDEIIRLGREEAQ